jgi:hypothetical protein
MVCGSLGVISRRLASDVDEPIKAFFGSAATVYQQQGSNVTGRRFLADRIGLGSRRISIEHNAERRSQSPLSNVRIDSVFAPQTIVGRIEDVQCTFQRVR